MENEANKLEDRITWDFTVDEQGFASRYGHWGVFYYKQFLPAGMAMPIMHPPKLIPKMLYDRAKRISERLNNA